ncbi:MAG: hypothetical protein M1142_01770 [Patescibacteria group bacterium]|nr:hypothetical protein [Patescibacteria group bacterium]
MLKDADFIGVDSETGQRYYDIEKRLPLDRLEQAFTDEFGGINSSVRENLDLLRKNTGYLSSLRDNDLGGSTTYFYRDFKTGQITHLVKVTVSEDPDQDLHKVAHEWLHGLSLGDIGKTRASWGMKETVLYGRIGPIKVKGILIIDQGGKEIIGVSRENVPSPSLSRMWEWFAEWRIREFSLKYFPEKFNDFHNSFASGYHGVSVIEWLKEQSQGLGLRQEFFQAVDQALINGDESSIGEIFLKMFSRIDSLREIEQTAKKELEIEDDLKNGKINIEEMKKERDQNYHSLIHLFRNSK